MYTVSRRCILWVERWFRLSLTPPTLCRDLMSVRPSDEAATNGSFSSRPRHQMWMRLSNVWRRDCKMARSVEETNHRAPSHWTKQAHLTMTSIWNYHSIGAMLGDIGQRTAGFIFKMTCVELLSESCFKRVNAWINSSPLLETRRSSTRLDQDQCLFAGKVSLNRRYQIDVLFFHWVCKEKRYVFGSDAVRLAELFSQHWAKKDRSSSWTFHNWNPLPARHAKEPPCTHNYFDSLPSLPAVTLFGYSTWGSTLFLSARVSIKRF
jgi:hypothetical protein